MPRGARRSAARVRAVQLFSAQIRAEESNPCNFRVANQTKTNEQSNASSLAFDDKPNTFAMTDTVALLQTHSQ